MSEGVSGRGRAGGGGRELRALRTLARLHGVELRHRDGFDREVRPGPDALVAVLRALEVPLTGVTDAPRALRDENARRAARLLDPVHVLRPGEHGSLRRGPGLRVGDRAVLRFATEEGRVREAAVDVEPDGLPVPMDLPEGYHRVGVRSAAGETASALLVVAPRRAYAPPRRAGSEWGVFLPLHALRTERDRGVGDLTDLEALCRWVRDAGGDAVGLLPLFSAFTGEPHEPSPYAPVSRLFWNEIYLDPERVREWEASPGARELWRSSAFRERIRRAREGELVDYREVGAVQAELLEHLAATWHANGGDRSEGFRRFLRERPGVQEYAAFRATMEARGTYWDRWPGSWRREGIPPSAFDVTAYRRHLYAQLRFEEQLGEVAGEPCDHAGIYLDLPLGAHAFGYDTWAEPGLFAVGAGIGAPPDGFQKDGQNWGLAPVRPAAARATGHRHFRQVLQRLLPHASHLRIDHVMGLHRLYWVPEGMSASEGVYVRNPADEMYAILCLESNRHHTTLIGEDLGTVPEEVPRAMEVHGVRRMHVVPFELDAEEATGMRSVPDGALACLDTHDLPTFAQYWSDGETRAGLLRAAGPAEAAPLGVLQRLLERLGRSSAGLVIVNLEDLWLEDRPQNVPGRDHPANWRRRAGLSFEEIAADPTIRRILEALHAARTGAEPNEDAGTRGGGGLMKDRTQERSREGAHEAPRSLLTDDDLHLFNEGTHNRLYRKLGAHASRDPDAPGTRFAVWAPSAERVSVVGDFNGWDPGAHPLQSRGASGIWEGRVPEAGRGAVYKYEIRSGRGGYRVQKADPFGFRHEVPPATASMVWDLDYDWDDEEWMRSRAARNAADAPISVYEVHLGSWRRDRERPQRLRSYREIAPELARHVQECGFTHVELLPIMEHPFYGSWGYQTTGYFAPTSRHGSPQDFMYFVDHLHQEGIGVLLDWVPSHFPSDEHGLGYFDGTHLFEHADPRQGFHPDWESLIFNFGRNEVRSFLLSSALFWLDRYHVDGIRVDAVASMLYLDYSRKQGEWVPNRFGGRENLEAIEFLRQLNEDVYANHPDVQMVAEESTAWPMVSRPTYVGGLGFGMKWDMGWMHDTLHYFARDPIHRRHHHHELTFRGIYAFNENFMLPLSHDEVVHGKGSLLGRMAGDDWQKKANLRVLLANQALQPGKKLLFMGGELGQWSEWSHDGELDWALLDHPDHAGIRRLVGDLNRRYRDEPALHQGDFRPEGFEWVDTDDNQQSVLSFLRKEIGEDPGPPLLAVFNLTPLPRENYRLGVPVEGRWAEIVNTDAVEYGGTGRGNLGGVDSDPVGSHGRYHSLVLSLPPLAALVLKPEG